MSNSMPKHTPEMLELEHSETGSLWWRLTRNMPKSMPKYTPKMLELERSEA